MFRRRFSCMLVSLCAATVLEATDAPVERLPAAAPPIPEFRRDDPEAYGRQLAEYADAFDSGWRDEVMQGRMTLFDAGGDSVVRIFSRLVFERPRDGDKIITRFVSPAEIKGVAALTHENPGSSDDNWLYLPATKRVRRISGANNTSSFQGTEFTYEDLSNLDPREYGWRFVEETTLERSGESLPVYKLTARPLYGDTGYSRLIVFIHRTLWRQERIEYFDKAGRHLKTRDSSDWRQAHDRFWRPYRIEMRNHQTRRRTLLEPSQYFVDLSLYRSAETGKPRSSLPEALFTTRALRS